MPLPGEKPELNVVAPQPQVPAAQPPPGGAPHGHEQGGASLSFYLEAVSQGKWLVLGALLVAGLGLAWVLATQVPLYEADILLQVDAQPQNNSLMMGANIEGALSGPQSRVPTEIEVMQSRRLLGVVVDDLHLDVSASPRFFPKVGGAIAVRRGREGLATPLLGLKQYAWGGERIKVTRFDVPANMEDSSISLKIVARDGETLQTSPGTHRPATPPPPP